MTEKLERLLDKLDGHLDEDAESHREIQTSLRRVTEHVKVMDAKLDTYGGYAKQSHDRLFVANGAQPPLVTEVQQHGIAIDRLFERTKTRPPTTTVTSNGPSTASKSNGMTVRIDRKTVVAIVAVLVSSGSLAGAAKLVGLW